MGASHPRLFALLVSTTLLYAIHNKTTKASGLNSEQGDIIESSVPPNPPPEHGKSVYDPEIYTKYHGLEFTDVIPEEEEEDEDAPKLPLMPSYPWRGGGHEPMPLHVPGNESETDEEPTEYIMGYVDCESYLPKTRTEDDDEDEDDEEKAKDECENIGDSFGLPGVGAHPLLVGAEDPQGPDRRADTLRDVLFGRGDQDEHREDYGEHHDVADRQYDDRLVHLLQGGAASQDSATALVKPDENATELEEGAAGSLSAAACRPCLSCCQFFAEREEQLAADARQRFEDECSLDDGEKDFVTAECRTCHVRRRLPSYGVTLTCYECSQQQADHTCRVGPRNTETQQYRVSAKFFLTLASNDTQVTATQHSEVVRRRPQIYFAQNIPEHTLPQGHLIAQGLMDPNDEYYADEDEAEGEVENHKPKKENGNEEEPES